MEQHQSKSVHTPWRKSILIPLWCLQLACATAQFAWALTFFMIAIAPAYFEAGNPNLVIQVSSGIQMFLGLAVVIVIITSIVKFSRFRLKTRAFQVETGIAIAVGVVCAPLGFALFSQSDSRNESWAVAGYMGIPALLQLISAACLMAYAVQVRRRVLSGLVEEMKRPLKGKGGPGFVELGRK